MIHCTNHLKSSQRRRDGTWQCNKRWSTSSSECLHLKHQLFETYEKNLEIPGSNPRYNTWDFCSNTHYITWKRGRHIYLDGGSTNFQRNPKKQAQDTSKFGNMAKCSTDPFLYLWKSFIVHLPWSYPAKVSRKFHKKFILMSLLPKKLVTLSRRFCLLSICILGKYLKMFPFFSSYFRCLKNV